MDRIFHNSKLNTLSKQLRKRATKEENKLWYDFLKYIKPHFCRQKIIGNYIVDFYCADKKLIVELDGSQHFEEDRIISDSERTAFLNSKGFTVVRYPNSDITEHFNDVCEDILNYLK